MKAPRRVSVRLPREVHGDGPFANVVAAPGDYMAEVNPLGAVAVRLPDGSLLGLKPGEFEIDTEALEGCS